MYNRDIYTLINQNVSDSKTLVSACSVDSSAQQICSTKYFWEPLFIKNNLPLPVNIYNNTSDWLYEYDKTSTAMNITINFLNLLPNKLRPSKIINLDYFYDILAKLDIKAYNEPEFIADLLADGFTPPEFEDNFRDFGPLNITKIKFYIKEGLYIINFHFVTTDATTFYGNHQQVKDFLFYCFYNQLVKFSKYYPLYSPINKYNVNNIKKRL